MTLTILFFKQIIFSFYHVLAIIFILVLLQYIPQLLDKNEEFRGVFGSKGSDSGCMKGPNDVKCDRDGRFVVADTFNHRISWYDTVSIYFLEWPYYCIISIAESTVYTYHVLLCASTKSHASEKNKNPYFRILKIGSDVFLSLIPNHPT